MITTGKFVRKPFYIDAVQITEANMAEVAKWCMGEVCDQPETKKQGAKTFIRVRVHHPQTDRQTRGMVGDWILYANNGYKVYTEKAFARNFDPVFEEVGYISDEGVNANRDDLKTVKTLSGKRYRDAVTGNYVTEEYAMENPDTTVGETESGKTAGEINEDRGVTPA